MPPKKLSSGLQRGQSVLHVAGAAVTFSPSAGTAAAVDGNLALTAGHGRSPDPQHAADIAVLMQPASPPAASAVASDGSSEDDDSTPAERKRKRRVESALYGFENRALKKKFYEVCCFCFINNNSPSHTILLLPCLLFPSTSSPDFLSGQTWPRRQDSEVLQAVHESMASRCLGCCRVRWGIRPCGNSSQSAAAVLGGSRHHHSCYQARKLSAQHQQRTT